MKTYFVHSLAQDKSWDIIMEEITTTINVKQFFKKDVVLKKTKYHPKRAVLYVEK